MRREGDEEVSSSGEREDDTAELTVPDDEWPVPPEYRDARQQVARAEPAPAPAPAAPAPAAPAPAAPAPPAAPRRLPPSVVPGLLVLALLLIVGGVALAFALRDDPAASERAQRDATNPATTAPTQTTDTGTTTSPPTVSIPNVSGISVDDARERLAERGLDARIREVEAEQPEGEVVGQTPDPGRKVQRDTTIVLLVSSGPPGVEVPDVVGLLRERAESELREAGLMADVRTSASSVRPGTVLEQSPAAGVQVDPESRVRLVVAAKPERVRVPRVVGRPVADARARLREAGLRSTVTRVESTREAGTVLGQSPAAGSSVREGQVIRLEVSSGPALVTVPDVVGLDEASARQELQAVGFSVRVVTEETSEPSENGLVVGQRPLGGSSAESGATVTITVAVFV